MSFAVNTERVCVGASVILKIIYKCIIVWALNNIGRASRVNVRFAMDLFFCCWPKKSKFNIFTHCKLYEKALHSEFPQSPLYFSNLVDMFIYTRIDYTYHTNRRNVCATFWAWCCCFVRDCDIPSNQRRRGASPTYSHLRHLGTLRGIRDLALT